MKFRMCFGLIFLVILSIFIPLACSQSGSNNNPTSPSSGNSNSATTFTPTATVTSTPTITPTPDCVGYTDVTSNIDGASIAGLDTGKPAMALEGYGPSGDVYTFTLTTTKILNFSLCATDDDSRDMVLFVRQNHCWNESGESFNDDFCDLLPEITGVSLGPGTYYIIAADHDASVPPAPYTMIIKSGNLSPVYTVTPTVSSTALTAGNQRTCAAAYNIGNSVTGEYVFTGQLDDTVNVDDYYSFTPLNSGTVTVTMDGFDNGLGQADFDLYGYSNCPTVTSVGSSTTNNPVETFSFLVTAGATYYLQANAYFGGGTYRLTVQTP